MKTKTEKLSSLNTLCWPASFEEADIALPDDWPVVFEDFSVWLLTDDSFGVRKFAAGAHRQLIEEMAGLSSGHCSKRKQWAAMAARARLAMHEALASTADEECYAAVVAAHAVASAQLTGNKQWAVRACAAAAATNGFGWSAYARSFSVDVIYRQAHARALAAMNSEFFDVLGLAYAGNDRCVA